MLKKIVITSILLVLTGALAILYLTPEYRVNVTEDYIYFRGEINAQSVVEVINQYYQMPNRPKVLKISSPGGELRAGMNFGKFVYANKLDVIVIDRCFSSCANYVFPAGKNKYLPDSSALMFHTAARDISNLKEGLLNMEDYYVLKEDCGQVTTNSQGVKISIQGKECRTKSEQAHINWVIKQASEETTFYSNINVDPLLPYYGKLVLANECPHDCFYYYTSESIERMGIFISTDKPHERNIDYSSKFIKLDITERAIEKYSENIGDLAFIDHENKYPQLIQLLEQATLSQMSK